MKATEKNLDQVRSVIEAVLVSADTPVTPGRLTALFEPLVILGMGIAVGTIVLSLLMAITSINDVPF